MQKLIIDTNILQYGVSVQYSDQILELFTKLKNRKLDLYISAITIFEIYRGIKSEKIDDVKKLVDAFSPLVPDELTYKIAAVLATCYQRHEATKTYASKYNDGDTLIAASSFRDETSILTANGNDFPIPFFQEQERIYLKNSRTGIKIPVSIMQPDYSIYSQYKDKHYPSRV